jgi:hypothetical protein
LARAPITLDGRKSADKLVLVAPTQRQEPRDLTESDGFAVDNRLHYCWSEKCEAETLSDKAVRSFYWSASFHIESSVRVTVEAVKGEGATKRLERQKLLLRRYEFSHNNR